jgi:hypothetical protein
VRWRRRRTARARVPPGLPRSGRRRSRASPGLAVRWPALLRGGAGQGYCGGCVARGGSRGLQLRAPVLHVAGLGPLDQELQIIWGDVCEGCCAGASGCMGASGRQAGAVQFAHACPESCGWMADECGVGML